MNQTILESRHDHHQLLLDESKYKKSNSLNSFGSSEYVREREREQRERLEHLGLSEVEAVEYVLMLSRDEANANIRGAKEGSTSEIQVEEDDQGIFDVDFDTDHNDEEDDQSSTHSTVSGSRSSSTSSASIPTAWSSSSSSLSLTSASPPSLSSNSNLTTTTSMAMRGSIPRPITSSSNEKIQVSPPSKAEPMEAGQEWLVDSNAVVGSTLGDANTSMGEGVDAHIFPPIVPGGSGKEGQGPKRENGEKDKEQNTWKGKKKDRNRKDNTDDTRKDKPQGRDKAPTTTILPSSSTSSTLASASAWNIPSSSGQKNYGQRRGSIISSPSSTSTSASASTAPRNAWTSGGPTLSARISPPTAVASQQSPQKQQGGRRVVVGMNSNGEDLDEDLKLAIELSLVEARSRGEDV